jgi:Galactose-3-O-sulfotransferase
MSFADTIVVVDRNLQAEPAAATSSHNETTTTMTTQAQPPRLTRQDLPHPLLASTIPISVSVVDVVPPHRVVVFTPWNLTQHPYPCFHPTNGDDSLHWTDKRKVLRTRTATGLLFVKLLKTASSTGASVHLRLARNVARHSNRPVATTNHQTTTTGPKNTAAHTNRRTTPPKVWDVCQTRHLHGYAGPMGLDYGRRRNVNQSFLWSVVRDPVPRYVSEFLHFSVARRGVTATPQHLIQYWQRGRHANQHQVAWLSLSLRKRQQVTYADFVQLLDTNDTDALHTIADRTQRNVHEILHGYNFLGVAERLDETLVVLSLLLHRPLADVLHVNVKVAGGYDDGAYQDRCVRIPLVPSHLVSSEEVQSFLATDPAWQAYIHAEQVLYAAINASLDATIDFLGRDLVHQKVTQLRHAQQIVASTCRPILPCTSDGVRIPDDQTDCLQGDLACGLDCLDDVATRLELW